MIARTLRISFQSPLITSLLIAAGAAIGALWLQELRRDVFPDLSAPVFNVIAQNAAMGAEELETAIAIPLEVELAGLPEVRRIRSSSQLGVAQVTVEFEPEADYYRSRQFVAERVAQAAGQLPPGTEAPLISSLTGRLNEIFEFTLEADAGAADLMTLRDLAEFDVKNRLLAVPGVAAVERLGGYLRQFQVQLDPERMAARRVSLDEVLHAVDESNVNASGGVIAQGPIEWTVRAVGRVRTVDDLRATAVTVRGGVAVLLGDVADIREAAAVRRGVAHRLAGEVVSARVTKQFGADTVAVAAGVRQAVDDIRRGLPKGVQLRIVYDQSELVDLGARWRRAGGDAGRCVRRARDPAAPGQRPRGVDRDAHDPFVRGARGVAAAIPGRWAEHHDSRRPGDRRRPAGRRRHHHGREHPASIGRCRHAGRAAPASAGGGHRSGAAHRLRHLHRHRGVPAAVRHDRDRRADVSSRWRPP